MGTLNILWNRRNVEEAEEQSPYQPKGPALTESRQHGNVNRPIEVHNSETLEPDSK